MALLLLSGCARDLSEYDRLLEPAISPKADGNMLVCEQTGVPGETGGEALGTLYKAYFKIKKRYDLEMTAPLARWPKPFDTPPEEWIGIYALPLPAKVTELPSDIREEFPQLQLETWRYGEVAEILHVGSYASEDATIERLHQFIATSGYRIAGPHEEEYLKGPGMFGKGNPDKYRTIIRYQVVPQ